jgi:hypothetical protein
MELCNNVREEGQAVLVSQPLSLSGTRQRLVGLMQVVEDLGARCGCVNDVERMPSLARMGFLGPTLTPKFTFTFLFNHLDIGLNSLALLI